MKNLLTSIAVIDTTVVTADNSFSVGRVMIALSLPSLESVLQGRDDDNLTVIMPDFTMGEIIGAIQSFAIDREVWRTISVG